MNKAELIQGLKREDKDWQALLDQIGAERLDRPDVAGSWSIKDIIAHLSGWRRRTVARLQAVQRGEPQPMPPWPTDLQTDDEINDWIYRSHQGSSVRQVLDESDEVFHQLLATVEALPEEVLADPTRFPWMEGRTFRAEDFFSHFHEEHEADIRAWLARIEQS